MVNGEFTPCLGPGDFGFERDHPRAGEADLIVAKHRNGRTDDIVLRWDGEWVYRHDTTIIAL